MAETKAVLERVYDLSTIGVPTVVADIARITNAFNDAAKAKAQLALAQGSGVDGRDLQAANQAIDKQIDLLTKQLTATERVAASTDKMVVSLTEMSLVLKNVQVIQTGVNASMNVGTNAFNQSATQVTASALQVQNAMRTTGLAYNHANEVITSTGARLQELRAELAFVKAKTKEVNEAIKEGTGNYQGHISQLEQLTVEEERLKTAINEISAAQRTLNKTFNPALEQEQAEVTALANKQLQERNLLLRQQAAAEAAPEGSIAKARATAALYRTELARLNVTTAEGAKRQKELIAEIERLDTFIKANVDKYTAQKINIGNYPQYQEQFANITAALDKMRAKGQENTEEFKSLNTALVELTRSMGGLKGELALVEKEMQSMALAGQKGSAEYKALQARAVELRGAIRQVNADTGASANTFGKFNTILERTGLRMFAMMAVFQVVMSVIKALGDEWSKFIDRLNFKQVTAGKIAEATGNEFLNQAVKMRALRDEFNAAGASVNDRLKVIEKLNSEYEQNGLHLKNMADAEAFFTEKSDKFIKALELRAKAAGALKVVTDNYAQSIKEKADPSATLDEVDKRIFDVIGSFGGATPIASYLSTKKAFANVGENEADRKRQNDEAMRQMVEAQRLANKLDQETGLNSDPSKQKKGATSSEFDYTKAKLDAMNKLREMQAKLVAERIKQEAAANKEIADNEQNSLTDRLVGYAIYARDRKELLRNEQEAELQQVRNKIDQIAAIEAAQAKKKAGQKLTKDESVMFDGKGKLRSSEQTLLLNRDALSTEYDYLTQKFRTANAELAREIDNDLAKITASSMRQALDQTEEELEKTLTAIQERANNLTAGVLASGVRGDRKQRRLQGINQNTAIERDLAEIGANQQQQQQVQADIAELQRKGEHNAAMLALEAEYQKKLIDLKKQGASLQAQLQQDQDTKDETVRQRKLQQEQAIAGQLIDIAKTFADGYIRVLEERDNYDAQQRQKSLDWNKKQMDAQVQSKRQAIDNERTFQVAEEQLAKEKLRKQKQRAKAQAAIDYFTAVMKIIAANAANFEVLGAVQIGAVTATYFAQLAQLDAVSAYATGGVHKKSGPGIIGDGGEPELVRVGGRYFKSPASPIAVNMPAGAEITPFSQIPSVFNLTEVRPPAVNSPYYQSGNTGSGEGSMAELRQLHQTVSVIAAGLANLNVSLDTRALSRANARVRFKGVEV